MYSGCDSVGKPIGIGTDLNLYEYAHNNPVNFIDPYGLWYIDINFSGGYWGGGTGGIVIGPEGISGYVGGGGVTPGVSGSIMWSPQNPTPGWTVSGGWAAIIGWQGGYSFGKDGGKFWEIGIGSPGASATGYYVSKPWEWPWRRNWWPWKKDKNKDKGKK